MKPGTALLTILFGLGLSVAQAGSLFQPTRHDYDAGLSLFGGGTRLAVIDVERDGRTEFIVVTLELGAEVSPGRQQSILVFRSEGDGLFSTPPTLLTVPMFSFPGKVVSGDFDGDGESDDFAVAVEDLDGVQGTGREGGVYIYTRGAAGAWVLLKILAGEWAEPELTALAVARIDDDVTDDLVLANSASHTLSVFLSQGGFAPAPTSPQATCIRPVAVVLGDIDGAGAIDLAVACDPFGGSGPVVRTYAGASNGAFALFPSQPSPTTLRNPRALIIADLNNDSLPDIAVANSFQSTSPSGTVTLLRGTAPGLFDEFTTSGVHVGDRPVSIDAGDVDGDGVMDLLLANQGTEDISVLKGSIVGSGTTAQPTYVETFFPGGFPPDEALFADLDGAGNLDIAAVNSNQFTATLSSFLGGGDDLILRAPIFRPRTGIQGANAVAVADFNQDGFDDFALPNFIDDTVSIYASTAGNPGATDLFFLLDVISFSFFSLPFDLLADDLNQDGHPDLAVLLSPNLGTGKVVTFINQGNGTFPASGSSAPLGHLPWTMTLGHLDSDGIRDMAVTNLGDNTITVLRGDSNGRFTVVDTFETTDGGNCSPGQEEADCQPKGLAAGDIDGDMDDDLVVSRFGGFVTGGSLKIFENDGNGNFTPGQVLTSPDPYGETVNHETVFMADLDGDGPESAPDIVAVGLLPDDFISVFLNDGSGRFSAAAGSPFILPAMDIPASDAPRNAMLADLNRDGLPDLAVAGLSSNNVAVAWGLGGGAFSSTLEGPQAFGATKGPIGVDAGDVDGNALLDLVVPGIFDNVAVLFGCCNERPVAQATFALPGGCGRVTLNGSESTDPDSAPGTNDDIVLFEWFEDFGTPSELFLGGSANLDLLLSSGNHSITLRATDSVGAVDTDEILVTVVSSDPPVLTVSVNPATLWPPNHRMVDISADVAVSGGCGETTFALTSIVADEPDNAPDSGDGNTRNDIQIDDGGTPDVPFALRAERQGSGDGRIYTVTYTAMDSVGSTTSQSALVVVPHDQGLGTEPLSLSVERNGAGTVILWEPIPGALFYNVIRGDLGALNPSENAVHLGTVECVEAASLDTSTAGDEDLGDPPSGTAFFYLAEYNDGFQSSYGTESALVERLVNDGGCTSM